MDRVRDGAAALRKQSLAYAAAVRGALPRALHFAWTVARVVFLLSALWLLSVASYAIAYAALVPSTSFQYPVHFDYRQAAPEASVRVAGPELARAGVWQGFASLRLHVPESDANRQCGMVMLIMKLLSCDNEVLSEEVRPTRMLYKSERRRLFEHVLYALPLATGWTDESQALEVPIFDLYAAIGADELHRACRTTVALSDPRFEVYSARLRFDLELSGLRRWMQRNYVIASVCGVAFFLSLYAYVLLVLFWRRRDGRFPFRAVPRPQQRGGGGAAAARRGGAGRALPPPRAYPSDSDASGSDADSAYLSTRSAGTAAAARPGGSAAAPLVGVDLAADDALLDSDDDDHEDDTTTAAAAAVASADDANVGLRRRTPREQSPDGAARGDKIA